MLYRGGIESAAKRRIGRIRHDGHFVDRTLGTEKFELIIEIHIVLSYRNELVIVLPLVHIALICNQIREHPMKHILVREHVSDSGLRLVQLRRRHHFHGGSDFQRAVYGINPILYFFQ